MTLIAHITDLHLRPRGLTCYRVSDTNMLAERAIRSILALVTRPDAVVVTGDLTDRDDPREYAFARYLLGKLPMPVYLIPGNHDTAAAMKSAMPGYPGLQDTMGPHLCYTADIGSVRLIALDSSVPGQPHGEIGHEQLTWLDGVLCANTKPSLIAIHHPPAKVGLGHMDKIGLLDSDALADVIRRHDHVERIMCGHVHRPITTGFAGTIMTLAPSVSHQVVLDFSQDAPAQFTMEPPAYYLHHHSAQTGIVTHTSYVENYPGPFPFWSDEGVTWPGDTPE